ncbi:MAG: 3' terminal RNA ribose 2'-O-methyltransferase Hen1 [Firmicutes bacterium]|nr:3' terminal RNA ribose 2'-O-methyltransferase Hen1 [Bacillota bacterium]
MLLTITYKGQNSTNLGYLLHKNPSRPQQFEMSFGLAYVFYPKASETETTVALLLDINPIDLARGKLGSKDGGLFDYVNDRPYVSSSFMSTAISKIFGTAMSGKCDKMPDLVEQKIDLESSIMMLPCSGDKKILERIFAPLGYKVEYDTFILDDKFTEWGESKYINLYLKGNIKLSELLNHLYVLLPVFDNQKHYWIGSGEVEKLIHHGEWWLANHPEKNIITARYLRRKKSLINRALKELECEDNLESNNNLEEEKESPQIIRLNDLRMEVVSKAVLESKAKSVIDLGCGEGKLIDKLLKQKQLERITGVDVCIQSLERAKKKIDILPERIKEKITLFQGSLIYKDKRFSDYDVACVIEVIEHMDLARLNAFERILFEFTSPPTVILTTPNAEYNINYEHMEGLRHTDHRFEWTREEFKIWVDKICVSYGYSSSLSDIDTSDEHQNTPTQMVIFTKEGVDNG